MTDCARCRPDLSFFSGRLSILALNFSKSDDDVFTKPNQRSAAVAPLMSIHELSYHDAHQRLTVHFPLRRRTKTGL